MVYILLKLLLDINCNLFSTFLGSRRKPEDFFRKKNIINTKDVYQEEKTTRQMLKINSFIKKIESNKRKIATFRISSKHFKEHL